MTEVVMFCYVTRNQERLNMLIGLFKELVSSLYEILDGNHREQPIISGTAEARVSVS